ncbi:MAG: heliorhodopsin HeR [Anaerolineales bacterium]
MSEAEKSNKLSFPRLRRFNVIMGVLHLIQGVLMIVLSNDTTYPVYSTFLTFNIEEFALEPKLNLIYELRFGPAVGAFLLISAVAHFYLSTIGYNRYVENLEKKMNPVRFYEYAFSSSLMIVLIAMLLGIWDLISLIGLFGLNATMNFFGIMMEYDNQGREKIRWHAFIYGCIAGIIPWIAMVVNLYGSAVVNDAQPPNFVYAIIVSLFLFFNSFAVNMYLQYKKVGPWKNYLFGERVYIVLSLVAKTALAWQIFAGTLAPV